MNKVLGWVGSALLSLCALPEVLLSFSTGQCSLTWSFLLMWGLGVVCVLIPIIREIKAGFLLFSYCTNLLFISILILFKLKEFL